MPRCDRKRCRLRLAALAWLTATITALLSCLWAASARPGGVLTTAASDEAGQDSTAAVLSQERVVFQLEAGDVVRAQALSRPEIVWMQLRHEGSEHGSAYQTTGTFLVCNLATSA
jgi:hypothetical protein